LLLCVRGRKQLRPIAFVTTQDISLVLINSPKAKAAASFVPRKPGAIIVKL
jgi:hypothetical protein